MNQLVYLPAALASMLADLIEGDPEWEALAARLRTAGPFVVVVLA